jgi:hypothetical protein
MRHRGVPRASGDSRERRRSGRLSRPSAGTGRNREPAKLAVEGLIIVSRGRRAVVAAVASGTATGS